MAPTSFCLQVPITERKRKCLTFTWCNTVGLELAYTVLVPTHPSPWPWIPTVPRLLCLLFVSLQDSRSLRGDRQPRHGLKSALGCSLPADSQTGMAVVLGASPTTFPRRLMINCRSFYFLVVNHSPLKSLWRKHYISSHRLWTSGLALSSAAWALPAQKEFVLQPLGKCWVNTNEWHLTARGCFQFSSS